MGRFIPLSIPNFEGNEKKYVDGKLDEFTRGIQKANKDLSSTEARNNAKQMMNLIMQYYKKP